CRSRATEAKVHTGAIARVSDTRESVGRRVVGACVSARPRDFFVRVSGTTGIGWRRRESAGVRVSGAGGID
ncbi:MAG: hypothetical protein LBH75_04475, partial [Treponema sp.]|nr:hypothetical protein [Treponema sp.]